MHEFIYNANAGRVIFGTGTLENLPGEIKRLGLHKTLLLSTPGRENFTHTVARQLGSACVGVFSGAAMHTPVDVTDRAMTFVTELKVDGVIAIGGGSTIGLAKAISLRTDLPQIVVPTTYAGSEMTPIIGETMNGKKVTQTTLAVLPEVVIYDVNLTIGLPPLISGTSGINAIAHAVEALYARDSNPVTELMAVEGVRALIRALPAIAANPADLEARSDALYGAWLCGVCLGSVGMSLHHKLCHTLGGSFNLPHAETHTIILPHALAYNASHAPQAIERLTAVFGDTPPAVALYDLAGALGAKRALRDLGMPESGIEQATELAMSNPYWNPRPLEWEAVRSCIARAWAGEPPRND